MRSLIATLAVLGVAAQAAHAQTGPIRINEPYRPIEPILVAQPISGPVDLNVDEVVSVTDTTTESRLATLRLVGGATVTCNFWYPATPPMWAFRPWIAPVPGVLLSRALRSVKDNAGSYTRPFMLRAWRERFGTTSYSAYSGTELQLVVPSPAQYTGGANSGGLAEAKLVASGTLVAGTEPTWGCITLERNTGSRRTFHFLSVADAANMVSPIDAATAESFCNDLFVAPMWVGLIDVFRDTAGERFFTSATSWFK
jgi:hypothetical protein